MAQLGISPNKPAIVSADVDADDKYMWSTREGGFRVRWDSTQQDAHQGAPRKHPLFVWALISVFLILPALRHSTVLCVSQKSPIFDLLKPNS